MKKIIILLAAFLMTTAIGYAQDEAPDSTPDSLLTKKQAELRIQKFEARVNSLVGDSTEITNKVNDLSKKLDATKAALKDCNDEILRMLGATEADLANFKQRLGVLAGKVREKQALSKQQQCEQKEEIKKLYDELNQLRKEKLSLIPEHYKQINELARTLIAMMDCPPTTKTYTVGTWAEDKDCLWNIAGKIDIYGDPFLWPKIWQANTDKIRNPDIIFPGQVLTIPVKGPKSDEEMKAERKYWRLKKEKEAETQTGAQTGGDAKKQ